MAIQTFVLMAISPSAIFICGGFPVVVRTLVGPLPFEGVVC
jgi:hypothetical protein